MFDTASISLRASTINLIKKIIGDLSILDFTEFSKIDFLKLRIAHYDIYAKELSYFLKRELISKNVSKGLKHFGDYGDTISNSAYRSDLDFLRSQRQKSDLELKNTFIFALSASDQAPPVGSDDKYDSNLFWTSLGLPQISLPMLKSETGNPIGLSIIGNKGSDSRLLNFAKRIFPDMVE
jgi:Asp-tRNA(Asn)/Glu-tRNA(Gln) amidotransferase A subunit family amidase